MALPLANGADAQFLGVDASQWTITRTQELERIHSLGNRGSLRELARAHEVRAERATHKQSGRRPDPWQNTLDRALNESWGTIERVPGQ